MIISGDPCYLKNENIKFHKGSEDQDLKGTYYAKHYAEQLCGNSL